MNWYVIYTKPQNEIKVASALEKMGITTFCPVQTELRQWSDRKKKVKIPLFKSYVFVQLEEIERNLVFSVPGAVRYLFWLGKPAVVKDTEIETIRKWLNSDDIDVLLLEKYTVGDEITIERGLLKNQRAVVERIQKKKLRLVLKDIGMVVSARFKDVLD